jgi:tetratricopeptide (TPR) repeat protein
MDALKKAEQEKKKAAKRLEQVEANARADESEEGESRHDFNVSGEYANDDRLTESMILSLEPLDVKNAQQSPPQIKIATVEVDEPEESQDTEQKDKETTGKLSVEDINISEDLTMENTVSSAAVSQEAFEETQQAIDLNDTTIIEGLSSENVSAPFDDTFHGVLFEGEEENTEIYEETLPGVPADQLVKDIGGGEYQPTPVAAQTVFSAGRSKTSNRFSWGAFFVLVILALGSFSVFYYFTITPVVRKLPSPTVARGIESSSVPGVALSNINKPDVISGTIINEKVEEPVLASTEQTDLNQALAAEEGQDIATTTQEEEVNIKQEANQSTDIASNDVQMDSEISDITSVVNEPIARAETPIESSVEAVRNEPIVTQNDPVVEKPSEAAMPVNSEMLKISKKTAPLKQNAMISEAFKAYKAGQFESAERLYQNALQDAPENRDIHLGLAAIAINQGDSESAYGHYLKLLDMNPGDAFALSSLIALSKNSDPIKDESVIKTLLHKEGKLPYLYFALGNIYAKQDRWAEAQQAFFDAYSLDSTNPDYVLNLAISLDKIGQYATALDFYNVAIELSQHSAAKFNWSSVNDRIQVLNQVVAKAL